MGKLDDGAPYDVLIHHTQSTSSSSTITDVCISIERFLQNRAPICCLPFDCIEARHPGMTHTVYSTLLIGTPEKIDGTSLD